MFFPIYGKLYDPINTNNLAWATREIEADPSVITKKVVQNNPYSGQTHLHLAAKRGSLEMVRLLLDNLGDGDVDVKDENGFTPLYVAIDSDSASPEIVKLFIDHGADVNATTVYEGFVLNALSFGFSEPSKFARGQIILKLLLDAGVNVNMRGRENQTYLFGAVYQPASVAKTLLEAGADVDAVDANGFTPLYEALFHTDRPRKDVIKVLIEYGADVNRIVKGKSILQLAKESRRIPKDVKTLLETYPTWVRRRHAFAGFAAAGAGASTATRRGGGRRRRSMRQRQRLRQSRRH